MQGHYEHHVFLGHLHSISLMWKGTEIPFCARKESAMAIDPRKRQRKLERRAARRGSKHKSAAQQKSAGMGQRLAAAAAHPILDCLASEDLCKLGLGWLLLSRQL